MLASYCRTCLDHQPSNEIQLRNRDQVLIPPSRLALTDRLPSICFPRTWEQFPSEQIKIIRKTSEFDSNLKKYFINDLSSNITCNRLFCPSCFRTVNNWLNNRSFFSPLMSIFRFLGSSWSLLFLSYQIFFVLSCPFAPLFLKIAGLHA